MDREPVSQHEPEPLHTVIDDVKARQRNTVWPDTMVNGRSVDEYLWKGSPDAPLVQRIGACIFGIFFAGAGIWIIADDGRHSEEDGAMFVALVGIACFWLGVKVFLNGLRRRKKSAEQDP